MGRKAGRPSGVVLDGELLKARRVELGLTQGDVAELAVLGSRTVRTAEQGAPVSADTAKLIAATVGLSYIELLKPPPEVVAGRLMERGLAPLAPPDDWVHVDEQDTLNVLLQDDDTPVVCVAGPVGVGKTSLAQRLVAEHRGRWPDGVVWVAAGRLVDRELITQVQGEIADCLGFANRLPDPAVVTAAALDQAFGRHFWRWSRLLVLDDLADPTILAAFHAGQRGSKVVITTHTRWVAESVDAHTVTLGPWSHDQVLALVQSQVRAERLERDPEGTAAVLDLLGGVPLHAKLAAMGIQRNRHEPIGELAKRLKLILLHASGGSGVAPRPQGEPLLRQLMDRLATSLPEGGLLAFRGLALFGDAPFAPVFADAALGLDRAAASALLDALEDAYMLRYVGEAGAGRYRISEWALASWGKTPSQRALERVLRGATALMRRVVEDPRHDLAFASISAHLPAMRKLLDAATDAVAPDLAVARGPSDLPVLGDLPFDALAHLPQLALDLTALMRLSSPRQSGRWMTAAAAVARALDDRARYGGLAFLVGWWWFLRGDDLDAACTWLSEAAAVTRQTGPPDLAVSMALHAAMVHRSRGGMSAAAPVYREALALARTVDCSTEMLAGALLSGASALLIADPAHPRWTEALALAEEALEAVDEHDHRNRMLRAGALIDLAVIRYMVHGETPDPAQLDAAVCTVVDTLGGDPLLQVSGAALIERLGGKHTREIPPARDIFLGQDRRDGEAFLQHILEMAGQFGVEVSNRVDDSLHDTPLGHLSAWTVAGFPLGGMPGPAFDLLLPLEPIRELLTGPGHEHALRFVAALRSPEHDAYRAVQALQS